MSRWRVAGVSSPRQVHARQMLATRSLTPQFGIAVTGIKLSSIAPGIGDELLRLIDHHGVVIVRGQQLTPQQFEVFSRSLGPLATHPHRHCAPPSLPDVLIQSNIIENGQAIGHPDGARQWQALSTHLKSPPRAALQYAVEVPLQDGSARGDTFFANTCAAYDALDAALRQQLIGMRAAHVSVASRKRRAMPYFPDSGLTQIFRRGVEHPVVRLHPQTRRKCLFVNPTTTTHICGMNDGDSAALLGQLFGHIVRPEFVYRHPWQIGDVVLWDNCAVQFRTESDYALPLRRLLYRTLLKGSTA